MITFLFCLVYSFSVVTDAFVDTNLYLLISSGQIHGKYVEVKGRKIRAWLGIPYAKPPVGDLRFQKPQIIDRWHKTRWMDAQPKICHQTDDSGYSVLKDTFDRWNPKGEMSEDCLYLNVYAPEEVKKDLHTIVWIHGGGFYKGSVSLDMYNPRFLVAQEDVIVVSIQYRLGSFGLLYMGEKEIPGNMGLLDQAMAIQWVHENIDKFGGNPNKITLMGESAGSASVGYHMISNKTRHLFQKVILQSGSPLNFWAYTNQEESLNRSLLFTSYAGCKNDDFQQRRACLLKLTPKELLAADKSVLSMTPTTDGDFISKSPFEAIKKKDYVEKTVLAGLVQNEGMPGIIYFLQSIITADYNKFNKKNFIVFLRMMSYYLRHKLPEIESLGDYYLDKYKNNYGDAADQLFGDFFISCAAIDFIDNITLSGNFPGYFYYFNHRSKIDKDPTYTEVMHGAELQYVFGRPFAVPQEYNEEDRKMSELLMKKWGEFVKTGVPDPKWTPYKAATAYVNYLNMDREPNIVKPRKQFCKEWHKYSSYYETVSVCYMCEFLERAVWEATNWFTYPISWWVTEMKKCYTW